MSRLVTSTMDENHPEFAQFARAVEDRVLAHGATVGGGYRDAQSVIEDYLDPWTFGDPAAVTDELIAKAWLKVSPPTPPLTAEEKK